MKLKTQTVEGLNKERLGFLADLKGGPGTPIKLGPCWPESGSYEGIQARTDIAIALVKEGLIEFDGYTFRCGDRAISFGPDVKKPGDQIKLTWLDDDRLERELGDE